MKALNVSDWLDEMRPEIVWRSLFVGLVIFWGAVIAFFLMVFA